MTAPPSTETPRHTAMLNAHIAKYLAQRAPDHDGDVVVVFTGPQRDAFVEVLNSHASLTARVAELEANERAYETTLGRRTYNEVALYIDSLKEAITDLIEAIRRDSDDDGKGISGYTAARVSDAKAALSQTEEGRS